MCDVCARQGAFRTGPGFCVKVLRAVCVFGNGSLGWGVLLESVLMCRTLECTLCKYRPAVGGDVCVTQAVREHMLFDGLCSQDTNNKPWVLFKFRDS